jgi:hypothetical protein
MQHLVQIIVFISLQIIEFVAYYALVFHHHLHFKLGNECIRVIKKVATSAHEQEK